MKEEFLGFVLDQADGRNFLAVYFPVNHPEMPLSRLAAYDVAKVDVVELGMKAADAFADGDTVTEAINRALGIGRVPEARIAIETVRAFEYSTMGMIFGYMSEIFASEPEFWAEVDGLLCLGRDERARLALCDAARTQGTRITEFVLYEMLIWSRAAAMNAESYFMLQYLPGVTGARIETEEILQPRLDKMRRAGVKRPILVGIGISQPGHVRHAIDTGADGVVIGSMAIQKGLQIHAALEDYLCQAREVLDGG